MLGAISGFSIKEFLIPGARKHTHVPSQVTTGASLLRSGTYRTWKDKVHGIGFPEKSAQDQKKQDYFYKKKTAAVRGLECVSLWILHSRCLCHPRAGADLVVLGANLFSESQPGLTNLRNEEVEGVLLIGRKSRNPSKIIHLGEGGARVQRQETFHRRRRNSSAKPPRISNAWKSKKSLGNNHLGSLLRNRGSSLQTATEKILANKTRGRRLFLGQPRHSRARRT